MIRILFLLLITGCTQPLVVNSYEIIDQPAHVESVPAPVKCPEGCDVEISVRYTDVWMRLDTLHVYDWRRSGDVWYLKRTDGKEGWSYTPPREIEK